MTRFSAGRAPIVLLVAIASALAGCGKKGDPLPPLRPVPSRVGEFTARRSGDRIELHFVVPETNADGSTPPAVSRVEIYMQTTAPGLPRLTAAQLFGDPRNVRARLAVARPEDKPLDGSAPATAAAVSTPPRLLPGGPGSFVEPLGTTPAPAGTVMYFAALAASGSGRGRYGPPSEMLFVPLTALPVPPEALAITNDETSIRLAWKPRAATHVFEVFRGARGSDLEHGELLTPAPLAASIFSVPVGEFGKESCYAVRPVLASGSVTAQGLPSPVECITPVDTYPPAAPTGLQAVQDGTGVTLIWNGVEAADLAGYVVLRGEGGGENMQPLMRAPITETTFRDTTVKADATYSYAVYAADKAPTPNVSQLSNRQAITLR